ncbi:MAG: hypothetical protein JWR80_8167 [Bradyrhizobium sp.]|nr:hypothetical protein [Bradyrhizobium sp.]
MSPIHVVREGAVARLLLDRPDAGNAIDLPLAHDLVSAGGDFAARFVDAPTAALGATRELLLASATLPLDIHLNREAATIAAAGGHAESREDGDTSVFGSSPSSDRRVKGGC